MTTDHAKQARITYFLNDKGVSDAVYGVLHDVFTRATKSNDIHALAAERLAINLLRDAWRELENLKLKSDEEPKQQINHGV